MVTSKPKISVIVPIYKVEQYLHRCIDSILAQTFRDFELILVDDGSPDNCGAICDAYAAQHDFIVVIHKENGGLSDARNHGIDIARGEYLSFIDSDDWVTPDFLEQLYTAIMQTGCRMSICNVMWHDGERELVENSYRPSSSLKVVYGTDMYDSLYRPSAWNKLYERSIFQTLRYPKGKLYEDAYIYHEILAQLDSLVYTGTDGYYYFQREESIVHMRYGQRCADIIEAVYLRARNLDTIEGVHAHADEAYLAIYSRLAIAYSNLDLGEPGARSVLQKNKKLYDQVFWRIFFDKHYSLKQKVRFLVLRICPRLHKKMYPASAAGN